MTDHLGSMLEDPSIQHLISWSSSNDSFVMSPTSEFSKVLALVIPCYKPVLALVVADAFLVNISNIPTSHRLSDNSTCTAFIKVCQKLVALLFR